MPNTKAAFFRVILFSTALAAASTPACAAAKSVVTLDIPAASLDDALRAVGRQTGREIMYTADLVSGLRAPRLAERLTADEAIRRLLRGTGLEAEFRTDVVIIRRRATVSAESAESSPSSDIVVTGTRIRGGSTAPVQSIDREQARSQGINELGELARTLPQNYNGGQNPGVIGTSGGSENAASSSALNLRGLGPDATLTLINGHRVAYDAAAQGVDISAIPLIAVERLELLPDGSSALYGSDAVAGVANVILRSPFDGGEARVRLSAPTRGGGFQDQYSFLAGTKWDGGGLLAALDYWHFKPIMADQRRFTRSLDPSATIYPAIRQYSGVVVGKHALSDTVTFTVDGQFSSRKSFVATPFLSPGDVSANGSLSRPKVESFSIAPALALDLPGNWQTKLSGVHGISRTPINSISFSGGREFVQAFASYRNRTDGVELGAEGPLLQLPGGVARLAIGGGWRRVELDGFIRSVILGVPRIPLDVLDRYNVSFAYAEGALPLVGETNATPGIQVLRLNGAVRYEHYSEFGGVTVPKLSLRYDPVRALSFRASWGRSFKAPTLLQKAQPLRGFIIPASIFRPAPAGVGPVILLNGGNSGLKPERARTWTAGAVFTPFRDRDMRLEAVYYNIRYRDRVASPITTLSSALGDPAFSNLIYVPTLAQVNALDASVDQGLLNQTGAPFNPAAVSAVIDNRLANSAQFRVEGVDVSVHASTRSGALGRFAVDGTLSYIRSDQQLSPAQPFIQRAGTIFDPPHWRGRAAFAWQRGDFGLTSVVSHIGGTLDDRFVPRSRVDGFTAVDLTASWTPSATTGLLKGTSLTLSVLNLFEEEPDLITVTNPALARFDSTNYPSTGRTIGLTLNKRW